MNYENIFSILSEEEWLIRQESYDGRLNQRYETLFTLSNGYMGTRGSLEEGSELDRPGNFIAGIFDKGEASAKELVNTQHWHGIRLFIEGQMFEPDHCKVIEFHRVLDMKKGILVRRSILQDSRGRKTLFEGLRYVSRSNTHRAGMIYHITPLNYNGILTIVSGINGRVFNTQTVPMLDIKHLNIIEATALNLKGCYLETATRDKDIRIGMGTETTINGDICGYKIAAGTDAVYETFGINMIEGKRIGINKFICTYSSRESDKTGLRNRVRKEVKAFTGQGIFVELTKHMDKWSKAWDVSDIKIKGDIEGNKAIRFNIFHLISIANENDPKVSLGAKGLHGEGYKGHVFWDTEIFMLPFYTYTNPKAARTLLMYRYHMLEGARRKAEGNGFKGAQYPWESADTGDEECPDQAIDFSGEIIKVLTGDMEYHITADVAYAYYQYYRVTEDHSFMKDHGLEVIIETARFWVSRCQYSKEKDCYEIKDVIGPDEFHEGVDNNAYTNYMARWNIKKSIELLRDFKEKHTNDYLKIANKLLLYDEELESWLATANRIYIPFDGETGLIEQFEGYFGRMDHIITEYDENDMPLWPEGVDLFKLGETTLVKQADVLLLMLLQRDEMDKEIIRSNYEYYTQRTMHKSSLSPGVYAVTGLEAGDASKAYAYFKRTAFTDLSDNQGNTSHGLHAAAAGGTWQSAIFGFAGMYVDRDGYLCFKPQLPEKWKELAFKVYWKGCLLNITIDRETVDIKPVGESNRLLPIRINIQE